MLRKTATSVPVGYFELRRASGEAANGSGTHVRTANVHGVTYNVTATRYTPQQVLGILFGDAPEPSARPTNTRRASATPAPSEDHAARIRLASVTELLEREGSIFLDGARIVDFEGILREASVQYALSPNPEDYIYTVDIAVAADIANLNDDEFTSGELKRFDTFIGRPVYASYIGAPRHLNHKTDDPLEARGVVIEAHYHDDVGTLTECPQCHADTSKPEGRTADGMRCANIACNDLLRSEYVEILSAIDKKKDEPLAAQKKSGNFRGTSMGCECRQTECFVCGNVAATEKDFCTHIAENKGRLFAMTFAHEGELNPAVLQRITRAGMATQAEGADKTADAETSGLSGSAAPSPWKVIDRQAAKKLWAKAACTLPDRPNFLVVQSAPGVYTMVRRAKELCHGVRFKEQSDVLQPAEPSALTQAVYDPADDTARFLRAAEVKVNETLRALGARLTEIEDTMRKSANTNTATPNALAAPSEFIVVRVNKTADETYAARDLKAAIELARPEAGAHLDWCKVAAVSAAEARKSFNPATARAWVRQAQADAGVRMDPMGAGLGMGAGIGADAGVQLDVPSDARVIIQDQSGNPLDAMGSPVAPGQGQAPGAPGQAPGVPGAPQAGGGAGGPVPTPGAPGAGAEPGADPDKMTPEQMGVIPPPAEAGSYNAEGGDGDADGDKSESESDDNSGDDSSDDVPGFEGEHWNKAAYLNDLSFALAPERNARLTIELGEDSAAVPLFSLTAAQFSAVPGKDDEARINRVAKMISSRGLFAAAINLGARALPGFARIAADALSTQADGTSPELSKSNGTAATSLAQNAKGTSVDGPTGDNTGSVNEGAEHNAEGFDPTSEPLDTAAEGTLDTGPGEKGKMSADALATTMKSAQVRAEISKLETRYRELSAARVKRAEKDAAAKFARALDIALQRQLLDLEESPLKMAFYQQLSEPQMLGRDEDGAAVETVAMPEDLAKWHVQSAFARMASAFRSGLVGRAAELANRNEHYLNDAEADLAKMAMTLPSLGDLGPSEDMSERTAQFRGELDENDRALTLEPLDNED